jgi:hypothetical protein
MPRSTGPSTLCMPWSTPGENEPKSESDLLFSRGDAFALSLQVVGETAGPLLHLFVG